MAVNSNGGENRKICRRCKVEDGPYAVIHEHHINGNHKDDRPENKLDLCCNCHETLHLERWELSEIGLPNVKLPKYRQSKKPKYKTGMIVSRKIISKDWFNELSPEDQLLVYIKSEIDISRDYLSSLEIQNIDFYMMSISYVETRNNDHIVCNFVSENLINIIRDYIMNNTTADQKYLFPPRLGKYNINGHMSDKMVFNIFNKLYKRLEREMTVPEYKEMMESIKNEEYKMNRQNIPSEKFRELTTLMQKSRGI
jgi:hypothetical protein